MLTSNQLSWHLGYIFRAFPPIFSFFPYPLRLIYGYVADPIRDGGWEGGVSDVVVDVCEVGPLLCCPMFAISVFMVIVLVLAIYAIYSHLFVFTAPWDHLDVVVRLDSLRGDQRSLLL